VVNSWKTANPREKAAYIFFGFLGLGFWVGLFAGLVLLIGAFFDVEVFGPMLTGKLLEILLLSLFGMLCFSNIVTALSSFYLSDDLELLLSLPISRPVFFYSRFLDTLTQSSWMMGFFGLPVFLAYGLVHQVGPIYYLLLLVVIPAFVVIPATFGVLVATFLVNVFPARRTREALALMGILFIVGIFVLLRLVRPERLVNAQDFESLAAYVAELQAPIPELFPPRWASEVLQASLAGRNVPLIELGLLLTGAIAAIAVTRQITRRYYDSGWTRSQEAAPARLARSAVLDRFLALVTRFLPRDMVPIVVKDVKTFFRDPAQWSQLFLLGSLIVIYLFSVQALPTDMISNRYLRVWKNALAFLNLGMAGFVMAGIAVRFQFTAVSGEGRAFWMIRTAPVDPVRYLWAKALPGLAPMLFVGVTIIVASNVILEAPPAIMALGTYTAVGLAFGISGIAMGMGATWPNFKADNAARAASGPAGILFMVASLALVGLVLCLLAAPMVFILSSQMTNIPFTGTQQAVTVVCVIAAGLVFAFATVWPIRRAAPKLWEHTG
jgi:ABC-2 type transport system permease protein